METLRRRYPCFSRAWRKEEKPWDRNPRRRPSYIPELNISGILQIARIFKSLDKFIIIADLCYSDKLRLTLCEKPHHWQPPSRPFPPQALAKHLAGL
jgi:hypothetical protein